MLTLSVKMSKRRLFVFSVGIVILFAIAISIGIAFSSKFSRKQASCSMGQYNLCVKNNDERLKFLSQFGWEAITEPTEVTTFTIPSEFNSTYEKYNDIQRAQGLDLAKYKEKVCTCYTYQILNYNNYLQGVRANLLILDNKVIGGDISSVILNGFIHGFFKPDNINI